jgi:CelD/BcsL family acetyltransferase involved in cellulose biosynthesis
MTIALVTDETGLRDIARDWDSLWLRAPAATPFQSPAWMLAWWNCFGTSRPVVALASQEGRPCGLLACYILGEKLLPMGAGVTDYQDVLLSARAPAGTTHALLAAVLVEGHRRGARVFDFPDLPPDAALRQAPTPSGWRERTAETDCCPVLTASGQEADLRRVLPAGRLRDLRQARHRAERAGGWTFETADAAEMDGRFLALERLHTARWRDRGQAGVLTEERVRAFHRSAASALGRVNAARVNVLYIGGALAACCYTLLSSERLFLYLSGFDPRFAFESPGTILLGTMIQRAIEEGRREIHFLRGDEAYKFAWGGTPRMNAVRSFFLP